MTQRRPDDVMAMLAPSRRPLTGCAVSLVALLASSGSFGCAARGDLLAPLRAAAPLTKMSAKAGAKLASLAAAVSDASLTSVAGALETTSPHEEGAAFLARRLGPDSAGDAREADADERDAALIGTTARCPAEMALVADRVCVDRWEGAIVERLPGGGERAWSPFTPIDGHEASVRAISRPGVLPQGYISGVQAQLACAASGKRLCSAGEWEHACRGPKNAQFPYGQARRAGACNDDIRHVHPVAEAGAMLGIPSQSLWQLGMNQPIINQLPDTLLLTGERAECTNEYGVFDMVGNLHEWIDDPEGTFRGGYYMDTSHNGEGCAYATTAHDFDYHDYSTGFRCCMDPDRVE